MQWHNADEWPGYLRYEATTAAGTYLCQKQKGGSLWRLAFRAGPDEQFKVIYTAGTLKSCKEYAEGYKP